MPRALTGIQASSLRDPLLAQIERSLARVGLSFPSQEPDEGWSRNRPTIFRVGSDSNLGIGIH